MILSHSLLVVQTEFYPFQKTMRKQIKQSNFSIGTRK